MKKSIFSQFSGSSSNFADMSKDKQIRERIKQRIGDLNLSNRQVSEAVGRHHTWLGKYLKTRSRTDYDMVVKLAKVLKTDVDWILGEHENFNAAEKTDSISLAKHEQSVTTTPSAAVPIVGFVEEGAYKRIMSQAESISLPRITINKDARLAQVEHYCFSIRGNTMKSRGISDGDVVICVDMIASGLPLITGTLVVVERADAGFVERILREVETQNGMVRLSSPDVPGDVIEFERGAIPAHIRIAGIVVSAQKSFLPL